MYWGGQVKETNSKAPAPAKTAGMGRSKTHKPRTLAGFSPLINGPSAFSHRDHQEKARSILAR